MKSPTVLIVGCKVRWRVRGGFATGTITGITRTGRYYVRVDTPPVNPDGRTMTVKTISKAGRDLEEVKPWAS